MSNLLWYILIAVISLGVIIYTIYKKRDIYKVSTLIVFFLFVAGVTWIGEFTVLGLFNSYAYKTDAFADPWAQNLLGHLILNTTLYPTIAVVMVAYSLRFGWIALFTALFVFLEYLFIKLGIYEQHWWRYYMTAIIVVVYLSISRYWFPKILQKPTRAVRALTFYFVAMVIIHTPAPILLLLGKQHYQLGLIKKLVSNLYLSSTIVAFTYHLVISCVLVFFTCILKKWHWKIVPFITSLIILSIFAKNDILIIHAGWKLIYYLLIQQICIAIFVLIEKYTLKPDTIKLKQG